MASSKTTDAASKGRNPPTKAMSLHLGLNAVSPAAYGGWSGELNACQNDANDMAALAKAQGMKPAVLLDKKATRAALLAGLRAAAKALKKGDLFFLTFSGHGGQLPDVTGEEPDKKDETWCLWDGQLIDDELYLELGRFAAGVRILVLSDSCHSGSVTRDGPPAMAATGPEWRSKMMPLEVGRRTYAQHQAFYDKLQQEVATQSGKAGVVDPDAALAAVANAALASGRLTTIAGAFKPSVILISGCQDNQTSMDGPHNGAFTGRLLKVWDHGKYKGNYASFHASIKSGMPASQTPNLFTLGPVAPFVAQPPFAVKV
jgi:metacaspase-1